jgi:hypothetical protein
MKQLKKDLESMLKDLKALTQKSEKIAKKLDMLEKTKRSKKAVSKATPKVTGIDTVFEIIKRSRSKKGVSTGMLKEKTGFDEKKLWNIINRLRRQGKIKSPKRGVYVKA